MFAQLHSTCDALVGVRLCLDSTPISRRQPFFDVSNGSFFFFICIRKGARHNAGQYENERDPHTCWRATTVHHPRTYYFSPVGFGQTP